MSTAAPKLRCALYTRKSSEEGLDQAFNSLHAQREACEAYVLSQAGEGWRALPAMYDDGGYSGGSMERPALQRLLADIAAGRVDVVVVYKIDRLTRALTDFARIVELFDTHKVSFVSVTQAFNTTTSMGRLTLNVLLSFAQFEREVTGERIRDKIAASRAKGMWMGGTLPLGYDRPSDLTTRALVVNETEAATVRLIFTAYLELGSVHVLERWLDGRGIRSKARISANGREHGGQTFSRGALFHLLRNHTYRGMVVHKGTVSPGIHPAIIDADLFDAVKQRLDAQARRFLARPNRVVSAPLTGRLFDADGQPMSPTFSHGARGQVYRYYVSAPLQQGAKRDGEALRRVAASALEPVINEMLMRLLPSHGDALALVTRVELYPANFHLLLPVKLLAAVRARLGSGEIVQADDADNNLLRLVLPVRVHRRGGRVAIETPHGAARLVGPDAALVRALRAAHDHVRVVAGQPRIERTATTSHARRLTRLAFLAPDLQAAILAGEQPLGVTLEFLVARPLPLLWRHQVEAVRASY